MSDPFDHLPDEDDLLAVSAVLDGTATVEDETRVRSNPDLAALLDEFTTIRDDLGPVASVRPPDGARDAAIAAALAAFDESHDGTVGDEQASHEPAAVVPAARVVSIDRRRRWAGVVTGAAAAGVAALFVGALAFGGLGGSDEDQSASVATEAAAAKDESRTAAPAADAMTEAASATTAAGSAFDAAGGASQSEGSDGTLAATDTIAAAAETTEAADDSAGTVAVLEAPAEVDTAATVAIATPEQLRDWAQSQQGVIPLPGLGLPCVDDDAVVVGEVAYQGVAVVVVREADETLLAYDPQVDCALVVSVEP